MSLPKTRCCSFSVLYGFWVVNLVAFNGPIVSDLATQFLALAEKQQSTVPHMVGHRLMSVSLTHLGDFAEARGHSEHAMRLYDPLQHRPLAMKFGQDIRVAILSYYSLGLMVSWLPRRRTRGHRSSSQRRPRDWPRGDVTVCTRPRVDGPQLLRRLRKGVRGSRRRCRIGE